MKHKLCKKQKGVVNIFLHFSTVAKPKAFYYIYIEDHQDKYLKNFIYIYTYLYIYIYTHIHTYIYTHTYIHTYTYIHKYEMNRLKILGCYSEFHVANS